MSGITAASYALVAAELAAANRRARQREEWSRFAVARAELVALRAEADSYRSVYGKQVTKVPAAPRARPSFAPEELAALTASIHERLARHRAMLRQQVAEAARQNVGRLLKAAAPESTATHEQPAATKSPTRSAEQETDETSALERNQRAARRRDELAERASRQLARLPADLPAARRRDFECAVAELTATSEPRARLILDDLTHQVSREVAVAARTHATRVTLAALTDQLDEVPEAEAVELRREIDGLIAADATDVPPGLAPKVAALVARSEQNHRRRVVAAALRLSLADLGYQVSEGFETVLADEGVAYALVPHARGYGLKVLLDADRDAIRTQVVRSGDADVDRRSDVDAEKGFCASYPDLLGRLRRHGVDPVELGARAPGQVPVQQVAAGVLPAAPMETQSQYGKEQQA